LKWQVLSVVRRPEAANTVCPPVGAAIRVDLRGNPIEAAQGSEEDQAPGCEVEMIGVKAPQEENDTYVPSWRLTDRSGAEALPDGLGASPRD
jgi:hypothetical protein